MADVAKFDASAANCRLSKTLTPSSAYKFTLFGGFPSATLAVDLGGGGQTSTLIDIGIPPPGSHRDGIFGDHTTFWQYYTLRTGDPPNGTITADAWDQIECDLTNVGGTTWDYVWKVGGVTLFTDAGVNLFSTITDPMPFIIGAVQALHLPGEIYYIKSIEVRDAADTVIFSDDFSSGNFSAWDSVSGDCSIVADPFIPVPPPPATVGYRSPFWEFVVLDYLTFEILTFLNHFATDRTASYVLNTPAVSTGKVPSDNPEVNIPWPAPDSDPLVTEGTRVLYGFRREGTLADPPVWVCRYAGLIMQLEDTAETDIAYSHYTAYDPWQYLYSRPVCNSDGTLPGPNGISFTATQADVIAGELLKNSIDNNGPVGIDAGTAYSGTAFYTGSIVACDAIDINFPQGTSVGQAWKMLTDASYCDILLAPIYDPFDRPGYLVQFNIAPEIGAPQDDAIFAWDRPSRSLVGLSRLIEGGVQRADKVKYFAGQGGSAPGGQTIAVQTDAAAVAKYGEYWRQQFFPNQTIAAVVQALAAAQLALSAAGRVTVALTPAPERSPIPFTGYFLGDRVPVYASERFRQPIPALDISSSDPNNYQRVYGIPLLIGDDSTERVQQLLTAIPA